MTLTVYKASAGSGKTFILTQQYLLLAINNPAIYKHILAVTFTNKATAEMKNRIIRELYFLSIGSESPYLQTLEKVLNLTKDDIQIRSKKLLKNILYNYSFFEISTIDSFFQKIIKHFSRESGIKYGYNVELDTESLLNKVIDQLLFELEDKPQLTKWLISFAEDRIKEGKSWNTREIIENFAKELLKETYQEHERELLKEINDKDKLKEFIKSLESTVNSFEQKQKSFGENALKLIIQFGLSADDFKYKKSGVYGYFVNISEKGKYEPGARALQTNDGQMEWHSKEGLKKQSEIDNCVNNGLSAYLENAIIHYNEKNIEYISAISVKSYLNVLGIVTDISEKLAHIRSEENILAISDINLLLHKIIENNDAPFIYEKTGTRFNHYLIDEFQDTSGFQWENFKPLLLDSLAQNNQNLVVGDVKQSIYRWRNGDWRLLLEKMYDDLPTEQTKDFTLTHNWRSEENIIRFNNTIFDSIPQCFENEFEGNTYQTFTKAYNESIQLFPENKDKGNGFVRMKFFEQEDSRGKEYREQAKLQLISQIDELIKNGYNSSDIAILVRKSADGQEVSECILEDGKYKIISKDSLFIKNSLSVKVIISVLKHLNDTKDNLNNALLGSLISKLKNISLNPEEVFIRKNSLIDDELNSIKKLRKQENIYEIVESIILQLDLNSEKDQPFIHAFEDIVLEYTTRNNPDIISFLDWWEENQDKKTINLPEGQDAITIMTIHKSKGLDFPVVIVPFCDWKTDHSPLQQNILWVNTNQTPFKKISMVPVRYGKSLENSFFSDNYFEEKLYAALDSLNLLYVAFTRAKEGLIAYGLSHKNDKSISAYLLKGIQNQKENDNKNTLELLKYFDAENKVLNIGEIKKIKSQTKEENAFEITKYKISQHNKSIRIKKQYEDIFIQEGIFESRAKLWETNSPDIGGN
jgi:ATP-dependent helicase/nuclease subunit A